MSRNIWFREKTLKASASSAAAISKILQAYRFG
jgi:hypothetical protein